MKIKLDTWASWFLMHHMFVTMKFLIMVSQWKSAFTPVKKSKQGDVFGFRITGAIEGDGVF